MGNQIRDVFKGGGNIGVVGEGGKGGAFFILFVLIFVFVFFFPRSFNIRTRTHARTQRVHAR